jgi:hypothetical protein
VLKNIIIFLKKYVRIKNNKNSILKYIVSKNNNKKKSIDQMRKAQDHARLAHHFWAYKSPSELAFWPRVVCLGCFFFLSFKRVN